MSMVGIAQPEVGPKAGRSQSSPQAVSARTGPAPILIAEIMYHPASESIAEEFIELLNAGPAPINVKGWQFSKGIGFTLPDIEIGAGERMVVAADVSTFTAKYPVVSNVVGDWEGQLSNGSETIELVNDLGESIDRVTYADQGDWAARRRGRMDRGHRGWNWFAAHDGSGSSLELIDPRLPNEFGQNWAASRVDEGTPGAPNSARTADLAPLILDAQHAPAIPRSTDSVTVTASIVGLTSSTARVHYRVAGERTFSSSPMADDGAHGDGAAGDGVFGAVIPPRQHGAVVEFYLDASDHRGVVRTWPAQSKPEDQSLTNALYEVDDLFDPRAIRLPGGEPTYRLIMTDSERLELEKIGTSRSKRRSDALMNGTFISVDGSGVQVRYNVGIRNRGRGTRLGPPNNYRINFPSDRPFRDATSANVNSRYAYLQLLGAVIIAHAGLAVADVTPVRVRVNGADLSLPTDLMYGLYAHVEPLDKQFLDNHFSLDEQGNLYRARDIVGESGDEGDLEYKGPDPDAYRNTYFKRSNREADDWSDLIELTDVLNNAPDAEYLEAVSRVVNVPQWMRYLALDSLLGNMEGGLNRGRGDDFAFYRGVKDRRFVLIHHDLDTLFGLGNNHPDPDRSIFTYAGNAGLQRFLTHPDMVPLYYRAFIDLIDEVFNLRVLTPLIDQYLGERVPADVVSSVRQFILDRTASVLQQIPRQFAIETTLPQIDGVYRTTDAFVELSGSADAVTTRAVRVNGQPVVWDARLGRWKVGAGVVAEESLVAVGSSWRYLDDGTDQAMLWRGAAFDDSSWDVGRAAFGYGDGDEATLLSFGPDERAKFITTYFRHVFEVSDPARFTNLMLRVLRDDGASLYLNGSRVASSNLGENAAFDSFAEEVVRGSEEAEFFEFSIDPGLLVKGTNVLAAEVHQVHRVSTDVSFDAELLGIRAAADDRLALTPGVNRVVVQAIDGNGKESQRGYLDIWYANRSVAEPPIDFGVHLLVRDSYLPGLPLLVRVDLEQADGEIARGVWDATAVLSTDQPGVSLSRDRIRLLNGRGSALVTIEATVSEFKLTATVDGMQDSTEITSLDGSLATTVSGTLSGDSTTWSGIVHLTGDVLVPPGHILTVAPGTLVLLDGVASGSSGVDLDVQGTITAVGTQSEPITFTAFDSLRPWGEIHHDGAAPSTYVHVNVTRAGNSPRGRHTGSGPAIRSVGSSIVFDSCNVTDLAGKVMEAQSSDLTLRNCHLARSRMGPEIDDTRLLFERNWITEMFGPDDADGIYIHSQSPGQTVLLRQGVVAQTDDDGIDTLGASATIESYIVRDAADKGISTFGAETVIDRALIVGSDIGISTKERGRSTSRVSLDHVTVVTDSIGIQAEDKFDAPGVRLEYLVRSSIISAPVPVRTDYERSAIDIAYSNVPSETWSGGDNLDADPKFVDAAKHDYRLLHGSPAIDTGDPSAPPDADGSRSDMGFFSFVAGTPALGGTRLSVPNLTRDTLWSAEAGPYWIANDLNVSDGVRLTIGPGTTVFFGAGAGLKVNGLLVAEGTPFEQIRFSGEPGSGEQWGGIQFVASMRDNRIENAVFGNVATDSDAISLSDSRLTAERIVFEHSANTVRSVDSSLTVRDSTFEQSAVPGAPANPHISGSGVPPGGSYVIEGNTLGGVADQSSHIVFDASSSDRVVGQIRGNKFLGGGNGALELRGDFLIEGNRFSHFQRESAQGESSVIVAGDGEFTLLRNTFVEIDHAVLVERNGFLTFTNNTVLDSSSSAIHFGASQPARESSRRAWVDGSTFYRVASVFGHVPADAERSLDRSIVPSAEVGFGVGNSDEVPQLIHPSRTSAGVRSRPQVEVGPHALHMGTVASQRLSVSGAPEAVTASTRAVLTIQGPAVTHYRFALDGDPFGPETPVDVPLELVGLHDGPHTVAVIGKDVSGTWQHRAEAITRSWFVESSRSHIRINEVLATSFSTVERSAKSPTAIELHNDGAIPFELSGCRITDNAADPNRFEFPAGTVIAPGDYLTLLGNDDDDTPGLHIGYTLRGDGDGVFLYDSPANGGALLDSVEFGLQLPGQSIGRIGSDAHWTLTQPTFGGANVAKRLGDHAALVINEWGARGGLRFGDDFVELLNPDPLPVALGGLSLSDRPISRPGKHTLAPLSFIAGQGRTLLFANAKISARADYLSFKLSANGGRLGLFDQSLDPIDFVSYGPQTQDVSQGRLPDGADTLAFFTFPTPGHSNQPAARHTLSLVKIDDPWTYHDRGADLRISWRTPSYDDSTWKTGPALLGVDADALPASLSTQLSLGARTYYFRTHFNFDGNPQPAKLQASVVIDDGAVIYLNGGEVRRLRMPSGTIDTNTRANRRVPDAAFEGPFSIAAGRLKRGDNVLAVEVHQAGRSSRDVVFGLALEAMVPLGAAASAENLRITELMYNPTSGAALEFIELKNIGAERIDLAGVAFADGVGFDFTRSAVAALDPGDLVLVVNDLAAFEASFDTTGMQIAGEYSGDLANGGERILLIDASNRPIHDFTYDDAWYSSTDGVGHSLVVIDEFAQAVAWSDFSSWRASQKTGGTPGLDSPIAGHESPSTISATSGLIVPRSASMARPRDHMAKRWRKVSQEIASDAVTVKEKRSFVSDTLSSEYRPSG